MSEILLCDGHNLAFRAFYGIKELTRSDGFPTNMIHGWLRTLWRLEDHWKSPEIAIFFDKGGCPRREAILPSYKANRGKPPEGFVEQLEWIKKINDALGYFWLEMNGFEADDLIASAVRTKKPSVERILMVSSDKDLAQLIDQEVGQLLPPPTANPRLGWRKLCEQGVFDKFGVRPAAMIDYLSIIGDQSDNIPGLTGVGPKTAARWLSEFGDLDNLIENAGRVTPKRFCSLIYENRHRLRQNVEIIRLDASVAFEIPSRKPVDFSNLEGILHEMEMLKSIEEAKRRYGN